MSSANPILTEEQLTYLRQAQYTSPGTGVFLLFGMIDALLDREKELKAPGPCGKHPKACWVGPIEGTPIPVPEKKFRGEGMCEYCGSQIGSCTAGEFCTNENCGYVDGWYNQRKTVEGHCTVCAELARYKVACEAAGKLADGWSSIHVAHTDFYAGRRDALQYCADELRSALKAATEGK